MRKMVLEMLLWGIVIMELGAILNISVIASNNRAMPVSIVAYHDSGHISSIQPKVIDKRVRIVTIPVKLRGLSDLIPIAAFYFSAGDIIVFLGFALFSFSILRLFLEYDKQKEGKI